MLKLIAVILLPPAISFACGYGVRDWMSRRRRKEVRKKFERYKPGAHTSKIENMTGATHAEPTVQKLHERLSRLEEQIANTTLEIEALRREAQIEFIATRELLERKFDDPQHRNNGGGRVLSS